MNRDEIISRLMEIITKICQDEDFTDIDPDIPLRDQVELDSVDFLEIIMELQTRYGIDVPEEDFMELTTLNRCADYLGPLMEKAPA